VHYIAGRFRARRVDRALVIDIACLLGHYLLWLAIPMLWFGVWPVLLLYAGLWATTGLLLALIFAPAHVGMPVMDEEQRAGWKQQLDTTRNLAMPRWLSWFFVGLDFQVEHHLFPRIPHQNLPRASDIVAPWCERVGVPYHRLGYVSSIRQVTRHVRLSWQVVPEVVVVKSNPNPLKIQRLAIGERVFYPTHGVAAVTGIEEHDFGDNKQVFYVLQLVIDRGVKLMLPERNIDQAGLRELISASKARELLEAVVKEPPPREFKADPASRKERANGYAEAFRSGSADRYTAILQELLFRSCSSKLSPSEQQTLDTALSFFTGEIGTVLDRPPREVEAGLRSATGAPAPAGGR
jgi:RNA polymerase-interacting CarD/CdnL/TRCF family regulator